MQDAQEWFRVNRHRFGRRLVAGLLRAVQRRRNLAGGAKAARFVLAPGVALDCVENCVHDLPFSGFGSAYTLYR